MDLNTSIHTKVNIYTVTRTLNEVNRWKYHKDLWRPVWATIQIRNIASIQQKLLFTLLWMPNFPQKFQVEYEGKLYKPMQQPIIDKSSNIIIFHAIPLTEKE